VDNSGCGQEGEMALTFDQFITKVRAGFYYGISDVGQFQVYISEFKRINRAKQLTEQGILSSKLVKNNTRLIIYKNGDRVLQLHSTNIIKWTGDKIILNTGGWNTKTTRARFNEFLPEQVKVFNKNGITFVNYCGGIAKFKDGMNIRNTVYIKEDKSK
jgi:hypothetical protein